MGEDLQAKPPLCVDLDGTLIKTDLLWESLLVLLKQNPLLMVLLPWWLFKGKAYLKHEIARRVTLDASTLPYDRELIEFLANERREGRELMLATASHVSYAQAVATHLGLFDQRVFGSDRSVNLKGCGKWLCWWNATVPAGLPTPETPRRIFPCGPRPARRSWSMRRPAS